LRQIFIVFEFAGGGDLHDVILDSPGHRIPEDTARTYLRQLADALALVCQRPAAE
jgi:serine/threonine protein kinase